MRYHLSNSAKTFHEEGAGTYPGRAGRKRKGMGYYTDSVKIRYNICIQNLEKLEYA